jgi:hypothetical protein
MAIERILLAGDPIYNEGVVKAANTITPGMFVKQDSGGYLPAGANDVGAAVAVEFAMDGSGIDDDYTAGEQIRVANLRQGDQVYAILATSQTIALGAVLAVAAGGLVTAVGGGVARAKALEAVTTTGATARIKIEII